MRLVVVFSYLFCRFIRSFFCFSIKTTLKRVPDFRFCLFCNFILVLYKTKVERVPTLTFLASFCRFILLSCCWKYQDFETCCE